MSAGFAVWCSDPTEFDPEDRDEFEHFCDAHGFPYTEASWVAFEEFIAEPTP